jgi:hypothetical protein
MSIDDDRGAAVSCIDYGLIREIGTHDNFPIHEEDGAGGYYTRGKSNLVRW